MKKYLGIMVFVLLLSGCDLLNSLKKPTDAPLGDDVNLPTMSGKDEQPLLYQSGPVNYNLLFSGIDQGYYGSGAYINSGFGISFTTSRESQRGFLTIASNRFAGSYRMMRIEDDGSIILEYYIQKFTKIADKDIQDAISSLDSKASSSDCFLESRGDDSSPTKLYTIELTGDFFADEGHTILKEYSPQEKQQLAVASAENGEDSPNMRFAREDIVNRRLLEKCGEYAGVTSNASKSHAYFIYNPQVSKTTFYFTPIFSDPMPFGPYEITILPDIE